MTQPTQNSQASLAAGTRIEKDSLGEIAVPKDALYGAHTARAIQNFPMSGLTMPEEFIHALALIKGAAAKANLDLKLLAPDIALAIIDAAESVAEGHYDDQFPVDVFQTGSGTSTNMNMNEVIANLAHKRTNLDIHPNDDVNMCQSSNDVIPTAIHVSASIAIHENLLPALQHLYTLLNRRSKELNDKVKTGRTHLMDAMPITMGQEISGWASQIRLGILRIESIFPRLYELAIGGTAVGTGINAHPDFAKKVCVALHLKTGINFSPAVNYFEALSCQDTIVELSGQLRVLAVSIVKICNDLRLMNSGPIAGLAEISLPFIQPGSSIMPGKVNPVIAESLLMACAQVIGNDATIAMGGMGGNFQLNTMLPVIANNILLSLDLLSNGIQMLANKAIDGYQVNEKIINEKLMLNPILITALNPIIGYEKGAEIAKKAYKEGKPILEVAKEMTQLSQSELEQLMNPLELTKGGIRK